VTLVKLPEGGEGLPAIVDGPAGIRLLLVVADVEGLPLVQALSSRVEGSSPFRIGVAADVALIAAAIVLNGWELDGRRCQGPEDSIAGCKPSEGWFAGDGVRLRGSAAGVNGPLLMEAPSTL